MKTLAATWAVCFILQSFGASLSTCQGGLRSRFHFKMVADKEASVQKIEEQHKSIWDERRRLVHGAFKVADTIKVARKVLPETDFDSSRNALLITAFSVAVAASIIRVGGRAALLGILGLDVTEDTGIKKNLENGLSFIDNAGAYKYLLFGAGWMISKNLCIDFLSIILALMSGIIFGGVLQGTVASVTCGTFASMVGFQMARTFLKDKVLNEVEKRPVFRAVNRSVSKGGFKTVLTLRLAPILPIPLGAYNYLYGVTSLSLLDFTTGMILGSIKPYLLDSYLGVFGRSIVENGGSGENDLILLCTFAVAVLVGTFASEIAGRTWDEMQVEMFDESSGSILRWNDMIGIEEKKLPKIVQSFNEKTAAAKDICWQFVLNEHRNKLEGNDIKEPPCPPPYARNGTIDYSVYLAESWVFNGVLLKAIMEFSDPNRCE